jgi:hypothetical protein
MSLPLPGDDQRKTKGQREESAERMTCHPDTVSCCAARSHLRHIRRILNAFEQSLRRHLVSTFLSNVGKMTGEASVGDLSADQQRIILDLRNRNTELEGKVARLEKELIDAQRMLMAVAEERTELRNHIRVSSSALSKNLSKLTRRVKGPIFPMEILLMIAEYLYIEHKRGTLWSLAKVCKALRDEVESICLRRVVCDQHWGFDWDEPAKRNARNPVRFLPLDKRNLIK